MTARAPCCVAGFALRRDAAAKTLATTKVGETLNPADIGNAWAVYDNDIDRVYSMEQSLRID